MHEPKKTVLVFLLLMTVVGLGFTGKKVIEALDINTNVNVTGDTVAGPLTVTGGLKLSNLQSCYGKLYTDYYGNVSCGTDQTGIGSCSDCDWNFVNVSGDTMTGSLTVPGLSLSTITGCTGNKKLVTDANGGVYCAFETGVGTCDQCDSRFVNVTGDTMTGGLEVGNLIVDNLRSCGKLYTDYAGNVSCGTDQTGIGSCSDCDSRFVNVSGDTMTGSFTIDASSISASTALSGTGQNIGIEGYGGSYGVYGSANFYGVYGIGKVGVYGYGETDYGVVGNGNHIGVYASGSNYGLFAEGSVDAIYASGNARVTGNLNVNGSLNVGGNKNAVVQTSQGKRKLSVIEAPTVNFVTSGSSQLERGKKKVEIDPLFLETVDLSAGYQVFLTPTAECSLYVERKDKDGFVVKKMEGKENCSFDWFFYGVRKGYKDWYLEEYLEDSE